MAEVRKNKKNAKYNIDDVKESKKTSKEDKIVKKNNKKISKNNKGVEKNNFIKKIKTFFIEVKQEFDKIHWLGKNNTIKYSLATIFFVVFLSIFFYLINVGFAFIQSLIG